MNNRKIVVGTLLTLLSGCATYATGPIFVERPLPYQELGILYIYRLDTIHMRTPLIKINDKQFVRLDKKGYSSTYLPEGLYKLTIDFGGLGSTPFFTELIIRKNHETFLRLHDTGNQVSLREIPKEDALIQIKEYRFVEPLNSEFK